MLARKNLLLFAALMSVVAARAQEPAPASSSGNRPVTERQTTLQTDRQPDWRSGSEILRATVYDRTNAKVGHMNDIVFDPISGRFLYAIVGESGDSTSTGTLRAVPWSFVRTAPDALSNAQSLNLEAEKLRAGPSFSSSQWPDFSNRAWVTSTYQYYGQPPDRDLDVRVDPLTTRWSRLSALRSVIVRNLQNAEIGEMSDVAVETRGGRILYGIITRGDKMYPVPWRALTLSLSDRSARLDATMAQFNERYGFSPDHWPDMSDPRWVDETRRRFAMQSGPSPITGTTKRP